MSRLHGRANLYLLNFTLLKSSEKYPFDSHFNQRLFDDQFNACHAISTRSGWFLIYVQIR